MEHHKVNKVKNMHILQKYFGHIVIFGIISICVGIFIIAKLTQRPVLTNARAATTKIYSWQLDIPATMPAFFTSNSEMTVALNDMFYRHYSASTGPGPRSGNQQTLTREM